MLPSFIKLKDGGIFMIKRISNYIINSLINNAIVKQEERKIYYYCIEGLIEIVGNLFIILMLGIILGKFIETLIFLFVFIPLRSIAGGYHVQNENICFVLSIIIFIIVIFSASYFANHLSISWSIKMHLLSSLNIILLCPVDSENKRLSYAKGKKLKIFSIILILISSLTLYIMVFFQKAGFCFVISNNIFLISLLIIVGYLQNISEKNNRSGV